MQACGIQGSVLQWIIKWLKNRKQRARIRGKDSNWINVTSGVPQGSVLGPHGTTMLFNMDKCAVMHVGRRNCRFECEMDNRRIRQTEEEKDLGVIIHDSAIPSRQCTEAAAKANKVLGMIRRMVVNRDKNIILNLYKTLVRRHPEYYVQVRSPYMQKAKDVLEKEQRRATRMIRGYRTLTYEERLERCGLTTLD